MENKPTKLPEWAIQAGETRARWAWAEPLVWTDRMLAALESRREGRKWFSLIDKVTPLRVLEAAFQKVKANRGSAGVDHQSVEMFEEREQENLAGLEAELGNGSYRPRAILRRWIPKAGGSGKRPLGIPVVRDRVVQTALKAALEPIFEREFAPTSHGFRPGRGCKDALREVDKLLDGGHHWVVDADIKSYFETIDQSRLMKRVEERVADGRVLALVESFLKQGIIEDMETWSPDEGTPQGAVISPLLANIYLNPMDHLMIQKGWQMVRYADDLVVLCKSQKEAQEALQAIEGWMKQEGLSLNADKTRIVDATQKGGFDFLGYHFERGMKWPRTKSLKKFRDRIGEMTRRTNGQSMPTIIQSIKPVVRGWFNYFKHSHRNTFETLDGWMRMRLRSILRKRSGKRGRGRGADHQQWPNAFFSDLGFWSLQTAHRSACQSLSR